MHRAGLCECGAGLLQKLEPQDVVPCSKGRVCTARQAEQGSRAGLRTAVARSPSCSVGRRWMANDSRDEGGELCSGRLLAVGAARSLSGRLHGVGGLQKGQDRRQKRGSHQAHVSRRTRCREDSLAGGTALRRQHSMEAQQLQQGRRRRRLRPLTKGSRPVRGHAAMLAAGQSGWVTQEAGVTFFLHTSSAYDAHEPPPLGGTVGGVTAAVPVVEAVPGAAVTVGPLQGKHHGQAATVRSAGCRPPVANADGGWFL